MPNHIRRATSDPRHQPGGAAPQDRSGQADAPGAVETARIRRSTGTNSGATLTETLSAAGIADAWTLVVDVVGADQRTGEPSVHQQADYTIVDLPLQFQTGPMKGRVAYNPQGQVAGLYILVPDIG